MKYSTEK